MEYADSTSDSVDLENQKLLPLCIEIEKISSDKIMSKWIPTQSFFKLIIILCLQEMKAALEGIRLLVQETEKINEVAWYFVEEEKLIELTVLLMMAPRKFLEEKTVQTENTLNPCMTFWEFIIREWDQLICLVNMLIDRRTVEENKLHELCTRRLSSIFGIFPLLEILEICGLDLEKYLKSREDIVQNEEVVEHVATLFTNAGLEWSSKDIDVRSILDSSSEADSEGILSVQDIGPHRSPTMWNSPDDAMPNKIRREADLEGIEGSQDIDPHRSPIICQNSPYAMPNENQMFISTSSREADLEGIERSQDIDPHRSPMICNSPYGMPNEIRRFISARYPRESSILLSSTNPFHAFWTPTTSSTPVYQTVRDQKAAAASLEQQILKFDAKKLLAPMVLALRKVRYR